MAKRTNEKESKKVKHKKIKIKGGLYHAGVKIQLIIGFLIPILFVVLVGTLTYLKAENAMIQNYEKTTLNCMEMGMQYLDVGFNQMNDVALEYTMNDSLYQYIVGFYNSDKQSIEGSQLKNSIQEDMMIKTSNQFIENIYLIPGENELIIGTDKNGKSGICSDWLATKEGKQILKWTNSNHFVGFHPKLDKMLDVDSSGYAFSYIKFFQGNTAFVMITIPKKPIQESLVNLELGNGSCASYITQDGREVKAESEGIDFVDQSFYQDELSKGNDSGTAYITYEGKEYLFLFSRSAQTNAVICALVPKEVVTNEVRSIKNITIILILLACMVAIGLAAGIWIKITTGIGYISKKIALASKGDLTVNIQNKKNDEFGVLGRDIMEMIQNTRGLIRKVNDLILQVRDASYEVKDVSERLMISTEDITESIHNIDSGVSNQAKDSMECVEKMGMLSDEIQLIRQDMITMQEVIDVNTDMVSKGILTMNELAENSKITTERTGNVKLSVEELEHMTRSIGDFVGVISDIAAQTNLLSLNASIEAARAGEAGKGFAIVAEEIRGLADGSREAVGEIQQIVSGISNHTVKVAKEAENAKEIVEKQADSVEHTIEIFHAIHRQTGQLMQELEKIQANVEHSDRQRMETLKAIESISAISNRTACSTGKVDESAGGQMAVVNELEEASYVLDQRMLELEEIIRKFTI